MSDLFFVITDCVCETTLVSGSVSKTLLVIAELLQAFCSFLLPVDHVLYKYCLNKINEWIEISICCVQMAINVWF